MTLIWGMKDRALTAKIGQKSAIDAGREIEWRPIDSAGHFVTLDSPDALASELIDIVKAHLD